MSELIRETKYELHRVGLTKVSGFSFVKECNVLIDDARVEVATQVPRDSIRHQREEVITNARANTRNLKRLDVRIYLRIL